MTIASLTAQHGHDAHQTDHRLVIVEIRQLLLVLVKRSDELVARDPVKCLGMRGVQRSEQPVELGGVRITLGTTLVRATRHPIRTRSPASPVALTSQMARLCRSRRRSPARHSRPQIERASARRIAAHQG